MKILKHKILIDRKEKGFTHTPKGFGVTLQSRGGFTLLETLVGLSILIIAITATFSAASNGLSSSIESKEQVTAYYLGQEAIEMIRNARDANSLYNALNPSTPVNWLEGISRVGNPCQFGKVCVLDAINNVFDSCSNPNSCPYLNMDTNPSSSFYGMYCSPTPGALTPTCIGGSWTRTNYKREISISSANNSDNDNEVVITVTMTWSKGLFTKTFKIKETILNWQS